MNHTPAPHWSPMVSNPDEDFTHFLDFGDLSFPAFTESSASGGTGTAAQSNGSGSGSGSGSGEVASGGDGGDGAMMDTSVEGTTNVDGMLETGLQHMDESDQIADLNGFAETFPDLDATATAEFLNRHSQQHPHHQQQQQQQRQRQAQTSAMHMQQPPRFYGHNPVPPTPNSLEMRGNHGEFYQNHVDRQQQIMYEHYRRQQNEQMNFTPLVSPAVTPLDTQFQNPEFAPTTDSFSPLTSPALRAQNYGAHRPIYGGVRGSDTSDTTSPIDPSLEYSGPTSGSTPGSIRKSKRTASSSSSKTPGRSVRQSPVVKPQSRRKQPSSTVIPPKEVAGIIEEASKSRKNTTVAADGRLPVPYGQDSSGPDSVSPEPLNEILMPPPATPKSNSAGRSPYMAAKQGAPTQSTPAVPAKEAPATPASLMKIRKQAGKVPPTGSRTTSSLKEQAMTADAEMEQIMEDIALPEAAASSKKHSLKPINIGGPSTDTTGPQSARSNSSKTPTSTSAPGTAIASPAANGLSSPIGTGGATRTDQPRLKIRDSRKRNSTSNQISPALRPKISPSIKPLLPEGGKSAQILGHHCIDADCFPAVVSPETSALLLASKSNYQNILEGTHLPGVSYPETLSTNLTSKRTSHKIAEQGRRNRINTALQEIASLLPPQTPPIGGQTPNGGQAGLMLTTGSAAQQSNSKASTVEMAIDYIKSLQSELKVVKKRLREVEEQQDESKSSESRNSSELPNISEVDGAE